MDAIAEVVELLESSSLTSEIGSKAKQDNIRNVMNGMDYISKARSKAFHFREISSFVNKLTIQRVSLKSNIEFS